MLDIEAIYSEQDIEDFRRNMRDLGTLARRHLLAGYSGKQFGGDRDLNDQLGYKDELSFDDYYNQWRRGGLGKAIIKKPVATSWRDDPRIFSEDDSDAWNQTWQDFQRRLGVYTILRKADLLSGIGSYGGVYIGLRDSEPDMPVKATALPDIQYLQVMSQASLRIHAVERQKTNPRYGQPLYYEITVPFHNKTVKRKVHWSRIIHIAENSEEDPLIGTPRLEPVFNRLYDVQKIVGGSAESYWDLASGMYKAIVNDPEVDVDWDAITQNLDQFMHKFYKVFRGQNIDLDRVSATPANPESAFKTVMQCIAAATDPPIPMRILLGSERGELASSQDAESWYGQIQERRDHHVTPNIIRPFIDRLMQWGALEEKRYQVQWEPLYHVNEHEQAKIALTMAQALKAYGEALALGVPIEPEEFRTEFLGLPEQSQPQIQNVRKHIQDYVEGNGKQHV